MIDVMTPRERWKHLRQIVRNSYHARVFRTCHGFGDINRHGVTRSCMAGDATAWREQTSRLINRRMLGANPSKGHWRDVINEMRSTRALIEESRNG